MDNIPDNPTCGYCSKECNYDEVYKHECLRIFPNFYIVSETNHFWGADEYENSIFELTDNQWDEIIKLSEPKDKENDHSKSSSCKTSVKKVVNPAQIKIDQEEQLIAAVMERPPLWNFTIPLSERSKTIKAKLWQEVALEVKGAFTDQGAAKRFKSLVDTFRCILRQEHQSSGSACSTTVSKWPHYHSMQFMKKQLIPRNTVSNFQLDDSDADENKENRETEGEYKSRVSNRKRKGSSKSDRESDNISISFEKIASAIDSSAKLSTRTILPPPPEPTDIEACVQVIMGRLASIPPDHVLDACQDLFNYSFELVKKYKK